MTCKGVPGNIGTLKAVCNLYEHYPFVARMYQHVSFPFTVQAGREIGGTHFITLDADEMFSANCMTDNFLRKKILALQPGDHLVFHWIRLWRNPFQYRKDGGYVIKRIAFCDDGKR